MKRLALILLSGLLLICVGLATAVYHMTGQPHAETQTIVLIPTGPHHQFSVALVPCNEREPGYLIASHVDFFSARYQPPWLTLPAAPPCP